MRDPEAAERDARAQREKDGAIADRREVDAWVQRAVSATNGIMYASVIGKLTDYPAPTLRLPPGNGALFVELGSNWGRWCIAASRLGYATLGVEPQLHAAFAATRVARQLGTGSRFVCADARYLPLVDNLADVVFSYSVLQHLDKGDVARALDEVGRVLVPGGSCLVQMPNTYGLRNAYHQIRRQGVITDFNVRYWTPAELKRTFERAVGPASISVDGFFSLNPQPSEAHMLPLRYRAVVRASESLRATSERLPVLTNFADSLYVSATKSASTSGAASVAAAAHA
jgi:SAM-dependent methyltransferase